MDKEDKDKIIRFIKRQSVIIFYLLQIMFILIYAEPEVEPFVYVRF